MRRENLWRHQIRALKYLENHADFGAFMHLLFLGLSSQEIVKSAMNTANAERAAEAALLLMQGDVNVN